MSAWISVKDRLPAHMAMSLVIEVDNMPGGGGWCYSTARFSPPLAWIDNHGERIHVSHWQPLPEPPK